MERPLRNEDKDLRPGQGLRVVRVQAGCKDTRTALGWGLATGVRSPFFSPVAWAWKTGLICLLDMPESFSQFGLWERDLVEARSRVSGVARSAPPSCPGQGNGVSRSAFGGRYSQPFSRVV